MLSYNPQKEDPDRLESLTCCTARLALLDRLEHDLETEIGAPTHQHHLIVGPRGSGKTHLLCVLAEARLPRRGDLAMAFRPVVLPEEVALRSPADLPLMILERLALDLERDRGVPDPGAGKARAAALDAVHSARKIRDPLARLRKGFDGLEKSSESLGRVLLGVVENLDSILFLGGSGRRRKRDPVQWALRDRLQESSHLMLLASAPSVFGAVADEGAAFYGFFLVHRLREMHNDEVLNLVQRRLEDELARTQADPARSERIRNLLDRFDSVSPRLRGLLVLAGGIPRFAHLICDVLIEANLAIVQEAFNGFLDELTPFFQQRLDPRLLPESEIELLHEFASSWGPLQPSELAERLFGVSLNEVGVLLGRLEERGMVARSGSPGGRAVTWDITEPLYRVWTHFRTDADGRRQFQLLADFIALLYTAGEISEERERTARDLSLRSDDDPFRSRIEDNVGFLDRALERKKILLERPEQAPKSEIQPELMKVGKTEASKPATGRLVTEFRSIFKSLLEAVKSEDTARINSTLDEARELYSRNPEEAIVRNILSLCIGVALTQAKKDDDLARRDALLDELRELAVRWSEDAEVRKILAMGLFNTLINAKAEDDLARRDALLMELRGLAALPPEDWEVRDVLARALLATIKHTEKETPPHRLDALYDEISDLARSMSRGPKEPLFRIGTGLLEMSGPAVIRVFEGICENAGEETAGILRPFILAAKVLIKGEEKALAREPKEMRRVVQLLLEKTGHSPKSDG